MLLTPSQTSDPPAEPKSKRSDPDRDVPTNAADEDRTMTSLKSVMGKITIARQGSSSISPDRFKAKAIAGRIVKPQRGMEKDLREESLSEILQLIGARELANKQLHDAVAQLVRAKRKSIHATNRRKSTDATNERVIRAAGQVKTAEAQQKKAALEFELYASKHPLRLRMY